MSSMDPLESLTHVQAHVPQWLTKLDDLIEEQFKRFQNLQYPNKVTFTTPKKHGSTESLRAARDLCISPPVQEANNDSIAETPPLTSDCSPSPNDSKNTFIDQDRQRKRKSGSDFSDLNCRPRKSLVIVYYDSNSQQLFEEMVKNIGTARNCLRKGKNAASFKARLASFGMTSAASPPMLGNHSTHPNSKAMMPTLGTPRRTHGSDGDNSTKGIIQADRDLEEAQNLCESAAHRMLRDGDCRQELERMKKRLFSCAEITKSEVERLQSETEDEVAGAVVVEAEKPVMVSLPRRETRNTTEHPIFDEKLPLDLPTKMRDLPLTEIHLPASTGIMEVDDGDSDAESIHIDMAAIRRTMRRVPRV